MENKRIKQKSKQSTKIVDSIKSKKATKRINDDQKTEMTAKKAKSLKEKNEHRLFIRLQKKIDDESEIKTLHPDIYAVRFPRQKRPCWCWAIFLSAKDAKNALPQLKKINGVIAKEAHKDRTKNKTSQLKQTADIITKGSRRVEIVRKPTQLGKAKNFSLKETHKDNTVDKGKKGNFKVKVRSKKQR